MKRKIMVGLDERGRIGAAHIDTGPAGRNFCTGEGLEPVVADWDGESPMFGRMPSEINQSEPRVSIASYTELKEGDDIAGAFIKLMEQNKPKA